MKHQIRTATVTLFASLSAGSLMLSSLASAVSIDGEGSYATRAETRTKPARNRTGTHQAIDQHFRFKGELRANDRTSMFLEFRLFGDRRQAYFGDVSRPEDCTVYTDIDGASVGGSADATGSDCTGQHQSLADPSYEPFQPYVTQAYIQYAFDYCLLSAGRRSREWGMGAFLSSGSQPFDTAYSLFDGITCDINIQKSQTLGISFGYDKLSESGSSYILNDPSTGSATSKPEDLDQYFVTIEFDNRKANAGSSFTRHVGLYFANILGDDQKTDVKFADLYAGFFFSNLSLRNELIFRLGKSVDPNFARLGGRTSVQDDIQVNKVDSIGVAGEIAYTVSRSGSYAGPAEFRQGNAKKDEIFIGYAYAPGDQDGYYSERSGDASLRRSASSDANNVTAMAFHRNFKPALLLFNERPSEDDLRIDGVFDPGRVMNASVFKLGYRQNSIENGNFEVSLVTASLISQIPTDLKNALADTSTRPIGYSGKTLGYEADLTYDRNFSQDLSIGLSMAYGFGGDAWKTKIDEPSGSSFMVEGHAQFKF